MTAVNAVDRAAADAAATAQHRSAEPSMEEILASIRRIIADDEALPQPPRPAPRILAEPAPPAGPVLTLVQAAVTREPAPAPADAAHAAGSALAADEFEDIAFAESLRGETFEAEVRPAAEPAAAAHAGPLMSQDAGIAVHASFEHLAAAVMAQNAVMVEESIRSMLRPLLKSWLDDNLPVIVEKLVRSEIERVARGGR